MSTEHPNPQGGRYLSAGDMVRVSGTQGPMTARDEHLGERLRMDLTPACDRCRCHFGIISDSNMSDTSDMPNVWTMRRP